MAQILSYISIGAFVIAAIGLILSVVIFIKFDIRNVYNDLTGKTAKRTIEQIRETNVKSGNKSYKPSTVNVRRGKLTETIGISKKKKKDKNKEATKVFKIRTEVARQKDDSIAPKAEPKIIGTGLIEENKGVPKQEAATELLVDDNATELLTDENATMLLDETSSTPSTIHIELLEEVILVGTEEVIV